jgi:crotonobetainyl-CoA:carnitine CoA-transferase CaiB-like acyl-CoA transferase
LTYVGSPFKITGLGAVDLRPSPKLGQHSGEVLREVGYDEREVAGLVRKGVVQQSGG